ncbi:MAG: hypothetical protein A2Y73_04720 [Chloroflexi bacterium RBG_13_56_8]|nr:MAG: hypothetical protein A2Y73_04720 [Chloroflexi bacterium RBG_13_56_8]
MDPSHEADNAVGQSSESQPLSGRGTAADRKVRQFRAAEEAASSRLMAGKVERKTLLAPSKTSESWRGAGDGDRHFVSMQVAPLATLERDRGVRSRLSSGWNHIATRLRGRRWQDILLFVLEVAALAGFLVILGTSYARLRTLNREARELQRMLSDLSAETLALTPVLTPSPPEAMSTAPVARQTSEPLPIAGEVLVSVTETLVLTATPKLTPSPTLTFTPTHTATPIPQPPRRLVISKIDVDGTIVEGDTWEDLKKGIGHRVDSAKPGEVGNVVLSAHNDVYGEIFRELHTLEAGDEVLVYTDDRHYRYVVRSVQIVLPTRVEFLEPTDYPALTLITCYPYLVDTHRVVVVAELAE